MTNSKTVAALFVGIAVGATAGLLLAPHKGTKTRKKILKKGNDILGNIKNKTEEVGEQIKGRYKSAKNNFSESF
jgi:gas vesicle protein